MTHGFAVGDDVEVHGLPECKGYMLYGKITKCLDNGKYVVDGTCQPAQGSRMIGHTQRMLRSFGQVNLRKITVVGK